MTIVVVSPHKATIVLELSTPYVQDRVLHPQLFDYEVHTTTMVSANWKSISKPSSLKYASNIGLDFCKLAVRS